MESSKILPSIKEDLDKEGLNCVIEPSEILTQTSLFIFEELNEERRKILEIKLQTSSPLLDNSSDGNASLQLNAFFPFTVEDQALADVAQFLHFLNFQVEVPGFYLNFIDNTILYRYVMLTENDQIPKKIVLSLVGIAMLFQDVFGQTLKRLAKKEVTFITLMEEIQQIFTKVSENIQ